MVEAVRLWDGMGNQNRRKAVDSMVVSASRFNLRSGDNMDCLISMLAAVTGW